MCYYVGIEALAGNALVYLLSNDDTEQPEVLLSVLVDYGISAVRFLNEDQHDAVLLMSRNRTDAFISWCSDLVEIKHYPSSRASISLRKGKTREDLADRLLGTIATPVYKALNNESVLEILLVA